MSDSSSADRADRPVGRRERKKAVTKAAIADAAVQLFIERGYDAVSVRDVAERADVAVATLFAHFPGKESLVFDENETVIRSLTDAIEGRAEGVDVLDALREWFLTSRAATTRRDDDVEFTRFRTLVEQTPALYAVWQRTWRGHRGRLAESISRSSPLNDETARVIATLVIEGYLLAAEQERPHRTLDILFRTLGSGLPVGRTGSGAADDGSNTRVR